MDDSGEELERLRAELQLLRYRFNLLVEHSAEAIYVKDLESRYTYINEAGARMMFQRPDQLIGRDDEGLFDPGVAAEIRADDLHVIRTGQTVVIRTQRVMNSGQRVAFYTTKRPWFDAEGRIVGVVGTTQDVSELVDAQREAAAATESFRLMVESMAEAAIVHQDGLIRYANPAALAVLGRGEPAVVGARLADFVRPEDGALLHTLVGGAAGPVEVGVVRPDQEIAILELSDVAASWCGEPVRVAIGRDVTAQRRMRGRLQDSERLAAVGMLATGIAHEIKHPLTVILGQAQVMAARAPAGPERDRLADLIDAAERIAGIVAGVSALGRPEVEEVGVVDLEGAADRALLLAGVRLRDRAEVVRVRGGVVGVAGSERKVVQILLNLLLNAAQAMGNAATPARITVTTGMDAGQVFIRVADTGPGVSTRTASRLFEPFVTTKPAGEGTGLGLWVSRSMAQELGGTLDLENPGGAGASFILRLPAAATVGAVRPRVEVAVPSAAAATALVRPRLLLVDDERLISDLLVDGLSGSFDIVATDGVEAALRAVEEGPLFDLILCDLIMPRGGGARLFDELGRRGVRPRMLFMSGGRPRPKHGTSSTGSTWSPSTSRSASSTCGGGSSPPWPYRPSRARRAPRRWPRWCAASRRARG